MGADPPAGHDDARLEEIMRVVLALAANDYTQRVRVLDGDHVLDGIAAGLNMLTEEVGRQRRIEAEHREEMLRTERMVAVGQLAAGVAHEINNPAAFMLANFAALEERVAAMGVVLEQLRARAPDDPAPGELLELVRDVVEISRVGRDGLERIVSIVRGLRSFARIESAGIEPVSLDEVAAQACTLVAQEAHFRARLVRRLGRVPAVMGDRTRLLQVVTNLLLNALQAIGEGAPERNEVEVSTDAEGARVVLRVRDTGRGIAPEIRARVFEPFFTTRPREHGTGLGLPISQDIARQHGGVLRFESTLGEGTTFELVLPLETGLVPAAREAASPAARGAAASSPAASKEAGAPAPRDRALRVLVIDDEEQLLRAYRRILPGSYEVATALGGRAALALLATDAAWDVILCDLQMPDVDGPAVFEWIQSNAPALGPRCLFCTGGAFTPRSAEFAAGLQDRLLEKPIRRDALRAAIEALASHAGV